MNRTRVAVTDEGRRAGESHPNARLTDAQVEQIRDLYEHDGLTNSQIAQAVGVPASTVRNITSYNRRTATAMGHHTLPLIYRTSFALRRDRDQRYLKLLDTLIARHGSMSGAIRALLDQHGASLVISRRRRAGQSDLGERQLHLFR